MALDIDKIRSDFPILSQSINGKPLIYFDNAATTQKPREMIQALVEYYEKYNSNIHRGVHCLSQRATAAYENVREHIGQIYGAYNREVVFTKSDTEAINLLAHSLGSKILDKTLNIVLSQTEHHSNIVPWQLSIGEDSESRLRFLNFTEEGGVDIEDLRQKIDKDTAILSLNWASNTFGYINPVEEIIRIARSINPKIYIIIDAAQFAAHRKFHFHKLGADFITFSSHKVFGPTGVGVLLGKEGMLEEMPPFLGGGDMIREVSFYQSTYNEIPYKFEAGTPNIADVIAFGATLDYLDALDFSEIEKYEKNLTKRLYDALAALDFITIYPSLPKNYDNHLPLVSFNVNGVHAHDTGSILDSEGIAVRAGHHCAQLVMQKLNLPATTRASLAFYNTEDEIDKFIKALYRVRETFD